MTYKTNRRTSHVHASREHSGVRSSSNVTYQYYSTDIPQPTQLQLGFEEDSIALKLREGPRARLVRSRSIDWESE